MSARVRYLVKDPDVYDPSSRTIIRGEWRRVWWRAWNDWRGEKKVQSGRRTLFRVEALPGWG
jgi:hypothetical protein